MSPRVALPLLLAVGFVQAWLGVLYLQVLGRGSAGGAAGVGALLTASSFSSWWVVGDAGEVPAGIAAYCAGEALGTYLAVRLRAEGKEAQRLIDERPDAGVAAPPRGERRVAPAALAETPAPARGDDPTLSR